MARVTIQFDLSRNILSAKSQPNIAQINQESGLLNSAIGMTGFEPAAPSSRTKCATKLRYIPLDHLKRQHQVNKAV